MFFQEILSLRSVTWSSAVVASTVAAWSLSIGLVAAGAGVGAGSAGAVDSDPPTGAAEAVPLGPGFDDVLGAGLPVAGTRVGAGSRLGPVVNGIWDSSVTGSRSSLAGFGPIGFLEPVDGTATGASVGLRAVDAEPEGLVRGGGAVETFEPAAVGRGGLGVGAIASEGPAPPDGSDPARSTLPSFGTAASLTAPSLGAEASAGGGACVEPSPGG